MGKSSDAVPFGKLQREEKLSLVTAWLDGEVIEGMARGDVMPYWTALQNPGWIDKTVYRVKPCVVTLTKPSVNWEHVSAEYNWLYETCNGRVNLSTKKPIRFNNFWTKYGEDASAEALSSFTVGTCNWEDSLTGRPKK